MARLWFFALIAVLAAGCGSGEPGAGGGSPESSGREVTVAALGDSITAGNPLYDPDPDQREALGFGSNTESQYQYWASRARTELEFANCGVFGERTDQIAARLYECTTGADLVVVQGGINDIAQALGDRGALDAAVRAATGNLDGILAKAEELGLDAAVANVLPWNNGHPDSDRAIATLNAAIAQLAARRGVPLLDFHAALESADEPGTMAPEFTDDGDHPSIEGYRILGELVARKLG